MFSLVIFFKCDPRQRTIRPHAKARSGAMALRSIQAFFVVALLHLQGQWV